MEWRSSGLSARVYAERHGYNVDSLRWWSRREATAKRTTESSKPADGLETEFSVLKVPAAETPVGGLEIVVGPNPTIRVLPGFCPNLLKQVIDALGGHG